LITTATTTIAVLSITQAEPYEAAVPTTVSTGTRAVIGAPTGRESTVTGSAENIDAVLHCDPVTLGHAQVVRDERTLDEWQVLWVQRRVGLGLDHTRAGLRRTRR